ncbi:hypothetical protein [Deinococcus sp. QL22]|uniref:hypothetical protein n=1 Tax=Deinococcus sp. QL22 TaxID=2939437 RepID=UPI00201792BC|nr:hypothetical protein [Deinococcus sp. QL22]UQN10372.1 hypothetical protein M1R55_29920 [Deinococcus sp. QL22]UQN10506.1 hypothetical protein M1R55_29245 [Deinococcus sp. QL22]
MALAVSPDQVTELIPGAPEPEDAHVTLALIWARGELARRQVVADTLTGDALMAARTAVAAKALAYRAGLGGTLTLLSGSTGGGLKAIKLPGLELSLTPASDSHGSSVLAAGDLDAFAAALLLLAVPVGGFAFAFPGAAR